MEVQKTALGIRFPLKLRPGAGRDRLRRIQGEVLKAEVTAPPVGGRANRDLIKLISKSLDIPKGTVRIEKGQTSPRKLIAISGLSREDFWRKLDEQSLV